MDTTPSVDTKWSLFKDYPEACEQLLRDNGVQMLKLNSKSVTSRLHLAEAMGLKPQAFNMGLDAEQKQHQELVTREELGMKGKSVINMVDPVLGCYLLINKQAKLFSSFQAILEELNSFNPEQMEAVKTETKAELEVSLALRSQQEQPVYEVEPGTCMSVGGSPAITMFSGKIKIENAIFKVQAGVAER